MNQNGINVLSLFDGISGAFVALNKAEIKINNYYSSEIDKDALEIQKHHYSGDSRFHPIGDVCKIDGMNYLDVDLVIFGSPCTQLSSVNKTDRSGLEGPDSKLFYEAIRILKEIKAHQSENKKLWVLCENVQSMDLKNRKIFLQELQDIFPDIKMLKINSSLICPTHRRRLYFSNIANISIPKPNDTKFSDVLVNGYTEKEKGNVILSSNVTLTSGLFRHYKMNMGNIIFKDKWFAELPTHQKLEAYATMMEGPSYSFDARANKDEYAFPNGCYRLPSVLELERMMTYPDGYVSGVPDVSRTQKQKALGLSFTPDVISHLLGGLKKD